MRIFNYTDSLFNLFRVFTANKRPNSGKKKTINTYQIDIEYLCRHFSIKKSYKLPETHTTNGMSISAYMTFSRSRVRLHRREMTTTKKTICKNCMQNVPICKIKSDFAPCAYNSICVARRLLFLIIVIRQ